MKLRLIFIIVLFASFTVADTVQITDFASLEKKLQTKNGKIKLVNFWATWCGPCMEEMKYFVQAQKELENKNIEFIYISLDFAKSVDKVKQVVQKKGMAGKQFLLKDDPNVYINKIDKNWEGQIPFTLIVQEDGSYVTHNAPFASYDQLSAFIKPYIK